VLQLQLEITLTQLFMLYYTVQGSWYFTNCQSHVLIWRIFKKKRW